MEPFRVLVTGSRTWTDPTMIRRKLGEVVAELSESQRFLTVVHGAATRGVDKHADQWAMDMNVACERYPADWQRYGRGAGFLRNQKMVNSNIDLCLAFIRDGSPGATHCVIAAKAAEIELRIYRWSKDNS